MTMKKIFTPLIIDIDLEVLACSLERSQ